MKKKTETNERFIVVGRYDVLSDGDHEDAEDFLSSDDAEEGDYLVFEVIREVHYNTETVVKLED